jgi:N utilization substance protein B
MLTRRHIRVKVLQSLYSYYKCKDLELEKLERSLIYSMEQMQDLYLLMLQLLIETRDFAQDYLKRSQQKHLATDLEKNPSLNFINNRIIGFISSNTYFSKKIENRKLSHWRDNDEYISILFKSLKNKNWYSKYLSLKEPNLEADREFVLNFYKEVIAPNDKIYDFLEDNRLSWLDDFPLVNTLIVKMLSKLSTKNQGTMMLPKLYKHNEDRDFALDLMRKVVLNDESLYSEIEGKTPNWDKERIADLDMIILKMGITEFLYFPSIPVRATINEYLEISKEYSTPKSSIFINGILDQLVKDFNASEKINKIGRGLR